MRVTKLVSQKRTPSRVNMYIDGDFHCGISLDTVAKYSLYEGCEIEEEKLKSIAYNEIRSRFLTRTVEYIARSLRTEYQIKRYIRELSLKKKGKWFNDISKEEVSKITGYVIQKLNKYGYIDDEKYAIAFIQSRIKNRPRGKSVLIGELLSKGVARELAEEKVNELVEDEISLLKKTYAKKFRESKITKEDRKKIEFLLRKGFSWDLIEQYIEDESRE